jgi:undecaprenyl diphosphate synthase
MATAAMDTAAAMHVAIIMDGNGRWAQRRGQSRHCGHQEGALAVERVVEAARRQGLGTLTLYAFSCDNWQRPAQEVSGLMTLFERYLETQAEHCVDAGIRLSLVGRRDRLTSSLRARVEDVEAMTHDCDGMHLRLAIDYSAREAIWRAAAAMVSTGRTSRAEFDAAVRSGFGVAVNVPDVDLLIRTGGEQRLSDFLLWESAYAELYFTDTPWPEFTGDDLRRALESFSHRERRFGGLKEYSVAPGTAATTTTVTHAT